MYYRSSHILFLLGCCLTALSGRAQSEQKTFWALNGSSAAFIWDNTANNNRIDNGSGTWDNSTKSWTFNKGTSNLIWRPNAAAIFGGNPGTGAAGTVAVSPSQTTSSLTFNPAASGAFILTGNTITNTTGNIIAHANATINSILAGSSGLTLTGTGTVTLGGAAAYTGATTIISGTLILSNGIANSLTPTLTTPIVITSGATLAADIFSANINLSGNISGAGALSLAGTTPQAQSLRLYGNNSSFTGNFSAPSTSRGMMWSDNNGTGNAANTGSAAASWNLSGSFGYIETAGTATPVVQLGSLSGTNTATILEAFGGSGTKTFQVGALNTSTTFAGAIQDNPLGGSPVIALTKVGTGTLTMTGTNNTYTGATTVNAGTLAFPNALPASSGWNITVNATSTPTSASSGLLTLPLSLSFLGKTVNIVLTGTSTGFTWTAVSWTGLGLLSPTLQLNGVTIANGATVNGTTVTYNLFGATITVKR